LISSDYGGSYCVMLPLDATNFANGYPHIKRVNQTVRFTHISSNTTMY